MKEKLRRWFNLLDQGIVSVDPRQATIKVIGEINREILENTLKESDWHSIKSIPAYTFVEVYNKEFGNTKGAGSESKGITIACYRPGHENTRGEFICFVYIKFYFL